MPARSWRATKTATLLLLSAAALLSCPTEDREQASITRAQASCDVELLGYAAIDAGGRYWFAEQTSMRAVVRACAGCELRRAGRVLRTASEAGTTRFELPVAELGLGSHELVMVRGAEACSVLPVVVASTALEPLARALADDASARTAQGGNAEEARRAWESAAELPSARSFPSLRGKRLRNAAYFAHRQRDVARMGALLAQASSRAGPRDVEGKVALTYYEGLHALERFAFVAAHGSLTAAAERARELGLASVASSALEAHGLLLERLGRFDGALAQLARARAVLGARAQESEARARHAINVSWVRLRMFEATPTRAHAELAERCLLEAFALASAALDRAEVGTNLAWLGVRRANAPEARRWLREAEALDPRRETYGAPYWDWLNGEVQALEGERELARHSFSRALVLARTGRAPQDLSWLSAASLAQLSAQEGRMPEALKGFREASALLFSHERFLSHALGRATFLGGQRATFDRAIAFFLEHGHHDDVLSLVERALAARRRAARPCSACQGLALSSAHSSLLKRLGDTRESLRRLASDEGLLPPQAERARAATLASLQKTERDLALELSELFDREREAPRDAPLPARSLQAALRAGELLVIEHATAAGLPLRLFVSKQGVEASVAGSHSIAEVVARTAAQHVYFVAPLDGTVPAAAQPWEEALVERTSVSRLDRLDGLLEDRAPHQARPERVLVIADSRQDLPHARREGRRVAEALAGRLLVAERASRTTVLAELSRAAYLHVAGHAESRPLHPAGDALLLADDAALTALEIARLPSPPDVVVLSTCGERALDPRTEPTSAELAEAFLAAGTRLVVAARRSAGDGEAERFMDLYTEHLSRSAPEQALRTASATLRARGDPAWDLFYLTGVP